MVVIWLSRSELNIDSRTVLVILGSGSLLYVLQKLIEFRRACQTIGCVLRVFYFDVQCCILRRRHHPGFRQLLSPTGILANMLPFFIAGVGVGRNQKQATKYEGILAHQILWEERLTCSCAPFRLSKLGFRYLRNRESSVLRHGFAI